MRGRTLFSSLSILLLFAGAAAAQNNTIRGKVRSTNGITINNAIVELRQLGGGSTGQTVTRNDGDFAFSGLEPAEYEIAVTIAGYEPAVQLARFSLRDRMDFHEVLNVEVILRAKQEVGVLAAPGTNFVQDVPKPARAAFEKGLAKLREAKSDEAIALLREATSLFNDYFNAHFQLGAELYRRGKLDDALHALERARQINDRDGAVFHWFGLVMVKQQKFGVAEYAFGEAVRLNATDTASHFYHGLMLIELAKQMGDKTQRTAELARAEQEMTRAWELSEKRLTGVYRQRARICEMRGDREAAARELESYLKAEPNAKDVDAVREMITRLRSQAR
ncbi:MAG TPA: carboxypeptidase regulatory-like domain-containing protein [Blastocatellia bacterium]|nr:carboxypeptidase regulatory-like domain-containing protein [Blastocatellia bacterium]